MSGCCTAALRKEEVADLHLAVAGREVVQHADIDTGWRLERCNLGLNLDPKTQTYRCAPLLSDGDIVLKHLCISEGMHD